MDQKIAIFLKNAHPSSTDTVQEIVLSNDLFSDGYLDSLLLLDLLSFLEMESGKKIPSLQVSRSNFRSISSITALLDRLGKSV